MFTSSSGFVRLPDDKATAQKLDYNPLVNNLRKALATGKTREYKWRIEQLTKLEKICVDHCDEIVAALKTDLRRPDCESLVGEVAVCLEEIRFALHNLKKWMAPESVPHPAQLQPGRSLILRQPKGVVLIISPWNFPMYLAIGPLAAAISAGCCAVLKPSELTPACSALIQRLVETYLDTSCYAVVQGAIAESTALLEVRFDHIFYTGNASVARVILTAAAKYLTPCTLELGGKSPAIVDDAVDLEVACRRILAGKCMNAGQICIAPDFVLCSQRILPKLVAQLKVTLKEMYGENPKESASFGRIVNARHWDRVAGLIRESGGEVEAGGLDKADRDQLYIPPTIISNADPTQKIMQEEIFGPVLPIVVSADIESSIQFVNNMEKPLALYVFTSNQNVAHTVVARTNAGGSCINDTVMHIANPHLPFGGTGLSGMGSYHGKHGFEELSHKRSVMYRSTWLDPKIRYAPYTPKVMNLFRRVLVDRLVSPNTAFALKVSFGGLVLVAVLMLFARLTISR